MESPQDMVLRHDTWPIISKLRVLAIKLLQVSNRHWSQKRADTVYSPPPTKHQGPTQALGTRFSLSSCAASRQKCFRRQNIGSKLFYM